MYIANEMHVSIDDLNRYFSGCFLIDPRTKLPATFVQVLGNGAVEIELPNGDITYYEGQDAQQFFNLETYVVPDLGWRELGSNAVYLTRLASSGGRRGLDRTRLQMSSWNQMRGHSTDQHELLSISMRGIRDITNAVLTKTVFTVPPARSLAYAVEQCTSTRMPAIVNSKVAVWPTYRPHESWALLYRDSVIGVAMDGAISVPAKFAKIIGDTDGARITFA